MPLWLTPLLLLAAPQVDAHDAVHGVIQQALKAESEFELERALDLWQAVIADDSISEGERFEANLRAGHLARILERDAQARLHYLYVLRRSPTFQLPVETGPKIRAFFEMVRQEVAAGGAPAPAAVDDDAAGDDEGDDELPPPPAPPARPARAEAPARVQLVDDDAGPPPGWYVPVGVGVAALGTAGLIGGAVSISSGLSEAYVAQHASAPNARNAAEQRSLLWYAAAGTSLVLGAASLVGGVVLVSLGLTGEG